jgi:hypothetical protein
MTEKIAPTLRLSCAFADRWLTSTPMIQLEVGDQFVQLYLASMIEAPDDKLDNVFTHMANLVESHGEPHRAHVVWKKLAISIENQYGSPNPFAAFFEKRSQSVWSSAGWSMRTSLRPAILARPSGDRSQSISRLAMDARASTERSGD